MITKSFPKYKDNLKLALIPIAGSNEVRVFVKSYDTLVAQVEEDCVVQLGYWSKTTQKHINYVAKEMNLPIKKAN